MWLFGHLRSDKQTQYIYHEQKFTERAELSLSMSLNEILKCQRHYVAVVVLVVLLVIMGVPCVAFGLRARSRVGFAQANSH